MDSEKLENKTKINEKDEVNEHFELIFNAVI